MNYGNKIEPEFLPDFNLQLVNHMMNFYHLPKMYLAYFGKVPSSFAFDNRDTQSFHGIFTKKFENNILGQHFRRNFERKDYEAEIIYVLKQKIILEQEPDKINIYFHDNSSNLLQELISFIKGFKQEKPEKAHINLIISETHGLENKKINFPKPKLDLCVSYNDDFEIFHDKITRILQEENKSGLHLLYGKPGTGKSTYIRCLCSIIKKEIVFLPGQMAQNLDNIAMTKYLIDNPNSVMIIEDAEELIVSRVNQRNSNLAMILNITDGILGESLSIQIIATFNTELKNIDPALKRKGRLKSSYEFKALTPEKANQLLKKEGIKGVTATPLTLAEVYNFNEEQEIKNENRKAVGFK